MNRIARKLGLAAGALVVSASAASAQVSYFTTGMFTGCNVGSPAGSCLIGSGTDIATLSFAGAGTAAFPVSFGTPISGATLGTFTLSSAGTGTTNFSFAGVGFQLTINQTAPTSQTAMPSATITGSFQQNPIQGGPVTLSFASPTFLIGPAIYSIVQGSALPIRLPSTGGAGQVTDLQANINVVPEPSTYALLATGIAGLGLVARRRRSAV